MKHIVYQYLKNYFDECKPLVKTQQLVERILIENKCNGMAFEHITAELQCRKKLVEAYCAVINGVTEKIAISLYNRYITELQVKLNDICKEQNTAIFKSTFTLDRFEIQVNTLINRIAIPLIHATIRWAYESEQRNTAILELLRISPLITVSICSKEQGIAPTITAIVKTVIGLTDFPKPVVDMFNLLLNSNT